MVIPPFFHDLRSGSVVNDTSPVFRFAEKFPDIPKTQLTQSSKGEYLPIGFAQVMEKPVDAHMLILPHNRASSGPADGSERCMASSIG